MNDSTPSNGARDAVLVTLDRSARAIEHWFARGTFEPRDTAWRRGLRTGIDTWLTLEEEVLVPALRDRRAQPRRAIDSAALRVGVLRDIVQRHFDDPMRLEGPVRRHVRATEEVLRSNAIVSKVDWKRLNDDVHGVMKRWLDEIAARSDVEDEDRDPVGLAPR